jgi:hypothetical protein
VLESVKVNFLPLFRIQTQFQERVGAMNSANCYVCMGIFLEPSSVEEIDRFPPPGRRYWSGPQFYLGSTVQPDPRCYDRYAWDIPGCGHPCNVVCSNRSNAVTEGSSVDRCGFCCEVYTTKYRITFSATPSMYCSLIEQGAYGADAGNFFT